MRKLLCILNLVLSCEVSTAWAQFAPVNEEPSTIKNPEPYNRVADVSLWGNGVSNKACLLLRFRP